MKRAATRDSHPHVKTSSKVNRSAFSGSLGKTGSKHNAAITKITEQLNYDYGVDIARELKHSADELHESYMFRMLLWDYLGPNTEGLTPDELKVFAEFGAVLYEAGKLSK